MKKVFAMVLAVAMMACMLRLLRTRFHRCPRGILRPRIRSPRGILRPHQGRRHRPRNRPRRYLRQGCRDRNEDRR